MKNNSISIALFYSGAGCILVGICGLAAILFLFLRARRQDERDGIIQEIEDAESRNVAANPVQERRQPQAQKPQAPPQVNGESGGSYLPQGRELPTARQRAPQPDRQPSPRPNPNAPIVPMQASMYTDEFVLPHDNQTPAASPQPPAQPRQAPQQQRPAVQRPAQPVAQPSKPAGAAPQPQRPTGQRPAQPVAQPSKPAGVAPQPQRPAGQRPAQPVAQPSKPTGAAPQPQRPAGQRPQPARSPQTPPKPPHQIPGQLSLMGEQPSKLYDTDEIIQETLKDKR